MRRKYVLIVRGIPGSGKSSYASSLVDKKSRLHSTNGVVVSADNYFIRPDGKYDFNYRLISSAHKYCFSEFMKNINNGVKLIVVDNTNIKHDHYKNYVIAAKEHGYMVKTKVLGEPAIINKDESFVKICAERNSHGVPIETIRKMFYAFEF